MAKEIIIRLEHKVSYYSMKNNPVINGFSPNDIKFHLDICDHSIVDFGIRGLCLGFSNTSRVDSSDMFIKSVVDQVKLDMCIKKLNHSKEYNKKRKYANYFIINMGLGDPTTYVYQFIFDENDSNDTNIKQYLLCMEWRYASS